MFSTECRKCRARVSKLANICPMCSAKHPGFRLWQIPAGIALVAGIWLSLSDSHDGKTDKAASAKSECLFNDGACYFDLYILKAIGPCQRAVESAAKYEYEWTDGAFDLIFSDYRLKSKERQLVFIGDKVKFTNGFNAKVNMVYSCTFDFKTKSIVDFGVSEGRL
ncbi:hypothetical protein [Buttiauxella brennerae]|uniref:hypothetical protein n=1 Tax=Buttiauxella brennerae TaxID=82988 RepID=UPI00286F653D|nr:hypothetical protein [Buttiauxella brennerae]